jgi:hypothetical protein
MAPHSSLRASDADRDAVAERLRLAAVEGRLEPDELEERLHEALRARTYGDLRRLLTDLPSTPMAWERRRVEARPAARIAVAVVMRVLVTLAVVAIVVTVAALMTAWWILWVVVWFGLCGRRSPSVRLGAPPPWDRSPRPWTRALALEADEARAFRRTPARCSRARTAR